MNKKTPVDPVLISKIRETTVESMVNDLLEVQPMPNDLMKRLFENAADEKDLIEAGYEPICPHTRMMWIKKDK